MTDPKELTLTKTYTITLQEEERLDQLSKETGRNKSELVRQAINDLFEKQEELMAAAQPAA